MTVAVTFGACEGEEDAHMAACAMRWAAQHRYELVFTFGFATVTFFAHKKALRFRHAPTRDPFRRRASFLFFTLAAAQRARDSKRFAVRAHVFLAAIVMDRDAGVLRMSAPTGADTLHLGTIASSSAREHQVLLHIENTSARPVHILLCLSEQLRCFLSLLSIAPHTQKHAVSVSSMSESVRSLSLANHVESQPNSITVPANFVGVYVLHLTTQNAWKQNVSDMYPDMQQHNMTTNPIPFSGHLVALRAETSVKVATLNLSGSCCESWLQPQQCVLHFSHCIVASWAYRDLVVRNKSQLSTTFSISVGLPSVPNQPSDAQFRFVDAVTRSDLNPEAIRLDERSVKVVRVGFLASKEGSEEYWLSVQNLQNVDNFWHVRVLASPKSQLVAHGIHVSCGNTLDFEDCYAYCSTFKEIEVRNNYAEAVNIALLSDNRDEISYEIIHDWSDQRNEHALISSTDHLLDEYENDEADVEMKADGRELPPDVVELLNGDTSSRERAEASGAKQEWLSESGAIPSLLSTRALTSDSIDEDDYLEEEAQPQFEENISLRSGQARRMRVWYVPKTLAKEPSVAKVGTSSIQLDGRLQEKHFQLLFVLPSGERRIVSCSSRVCESKVQLEQSEVQLGNCDLLTTYTSAIHLINCSDLPAALSIHYVSRCVVAASHDILIEPRKKFDLTLTFVPLHVNPRYHKEISITNERNPNAEKMVFTLRANCVDRRGISFHALFYKILAPEPTNEIDVGVVVANHQTVRAFRIRNETQQRLVLHFESFSGITTYASNEQRSPPVDSPEDSHHGPRVTWKDSLPSIPGVVRFWANDPTLELRDPESSRTSLAILDPGIGEPGSLAKHGSDCLLTRNKDYDQDDSCGLPLYSWTEHENHTRIGEWDRRKPLRELIKCLDDYDLSKTDSIPTFFENRDAEKQFADKMFRPIQFLQAALTDGCLSETDVISMEAEAECIIIVSLRLTDRDVRRTTKLRVVERKMKIRMLEFDQERLGVLETKDPKLGMRLREAVEAGEVSIERELPFTMRACKSAMSISPLSHLNFGIISVGEQRDKAFNIVNLSETPLLYEIRKSGASNTRDLRFNLGASFRGAISPYYTKAVPFIYAPTVQGKFEERIVIKNRLDESGDRQIVVKAFVVKSRIIWDESEEDD
eukprot:TRINITY_DN187_c1_g2_i1.p1 TRINITY_DN187_c1_g2~~TRINITY_DN187_c1_g2_i1.p1  ORF type:complete len:1152 (+),score=162.00 TRINITY_DN187_c1_g2_i1:3748-7203(+)